MTTATELDVREVALDPGLVVQLEGSAGNGPGEMAAAMGKAFPALQAIVQRLGLKVVGPPRTIYTSWDAQGTKFALAMPIEWAPATAIAEPGVSVVALPEASALRFPHRGAYSMIADTYARIDAWLRARNAIRTPADWSRYMPMWEEYVTDPATTPASDLLTYIYLPLR